MSTTLPEPQSVDHPVDRTALLSDLHGILPAERIITDPEELFVYESDGFTIAKARPAAVCFFR